MADAQTYSRPQLSQPVQYIKGVGPQRAELLEKLGLKTAADLLFYFPRSYQDFSQLTDIHQLEHDRLACVLGEVNDIDQQLSGNGRHIFYVLVKDKNDYLRAVWFNQAYLANKFRIGQRVLLRGKVKIHGGRPQMTHPRVTWLEDSRPADDETRLLPVYRLTDGINQRQMREIVATTVDQYVDLVEEAFPAELRDQATVCEIDAAIRQIHSPRNQQQADAARKRLVYQELLVLQLALAIRRYRVRTRQVAPQITLSPKVRARILSRLPFELTDSQQLAFGEVAADMDRPHPMNRLLHGEVGSGKTVVAVCAMLNAIAGGHQAVFMAPTEILARQHLRTLSQLLHQSRVNVAYWAGSSTAAEKRQLTKKIQAGEIDIVTGTHAIVASQIPFHQLGLVVIDEQHKFGVRQRALLKQAGFDPHYLVMTATPIPRTVSMTLFGDLEVSTLTRDTGAGQIVHTYLGEEEKRDQWWEFFRKKLREGRQGFVIAPLVDAGDSAVLRSAEQMYEVLANGPLEEFRLDVLHGRQSPAQKDAAMQNFSRGHTQVIVATGVVEVGIDVPNATVMTIESAERFGLSQLHQLRGRVSRGRHPGYVCAFASTDSPEENQRLAAFAKTNNGFELAEIDLKLRGPGNLFGTAQHGFPPLMIADVVRDGKVLQQARQVAQTLVDSDPDLATEKHRRLRQLVFARYGRALELSDVG